MFRSPVGHYVQENGLIMPIDCHCPSESFQSVLKYLKLSQICSWPFTAKPTTSSFVLFSHVTFIDCCFQVVFSGTMECLCFSLQVPRRGNLTMFVVLSNYRMNTIIHTTNSRQIHNTTLSIRWLPFWGNSGSLPTLTNRESSGILMGSNNQVLCWQQSRRTEKFKFSC